MKKRILALSILGIAALGLFACGKKEEQPATEATTEEVTVPAKKSKKASKAKVEPDAPVVDPVEE